MARQSGRSSFATGIALVAMCLFSSGAHALDQVKFRLDWAWQGYHTAFMAGVASGIYEKHGLKVDLTQGTGSGNTAISIASGADDFGFVDYSVLVKSRSKQIPIKAIGGVLMKNPYAIFTRPASNVKTAKDLEQLKLGMALTSSVEQLFPVFAQMAKIDNAKIQSNAVKITDISTRNPLFFEGRTDATFGYVISLAGLEAACKCKLDMLKMSDYGIAVMANGLAASEKIIKERPDVVKRFVAASREAIEFAATNPEKAIDLWYQVAKGSPRPREVNLAEWKGTIDLLSTNATKAKKMPYLCMTEEDWKATVDQLAQAKQIDAGLKPSDMYTNEFAGCKTPG